MTIAVSATQPNLDAGVDPRFGRAACFLFVDPDTMNFETADNAGAGAASGAGIQTARMLADRGVTVLLTGNCGPNAFSTLQAAGIEVFVGAQGSVRQAIEAYRAGRLQSASGPDVPAHHGLGGAGMPGMGRGGGRGGGRNRY